MNLFAQYFTGIIDGVTAQLVISYKVFTEVMITICTTLNTENVVSQPTIHIGGVPAMIRISRFPLIVLEQVNANRATSSLAYTEAAVTD